MHATHWRTGNLESIAATDGQTIASPTLPIEDRPQPRANRAATP